MYSPTSLVQSLSPSFIWHYLLRLLFTILPLVGYGTSSKYSYSDTSRQGQFGCLLLQPPLPIGPPTTARHQPVAQRRRRAGALLGLGASTWDAFLGASATAARTVASARAARAFAFSRVEVPSSQPPALRSEGSPKRRPPSSFPARCL